MRVVAFRSNNACGEREMYCFNNQMLARKSCVRILVEVNKEQWKYLGGGIKVLKILSWYKPSSIFNFIGRIGGFDFN